MPVASSQKEPQIVQYHHLLPKPPPCHASHITSNYVPNPDNICGAESLALMPEGASQIQSSLEGQGHYISTHSPPILNLSPNLSPTEPQRTSPFYDLRESTRRRGIQDLHSNYNQQMQHSPQIYSGVISDDPTRKSESPSRKRRKTSGSIVDLTNSPSPPPNRDAILDAARSVRRRSSTQRRLPGERCVTPRARRSPGTRRRVTRERNTARQSESPERRAFQPPILTGRQLHPASILPGQSPQHPVVIDVDQVQVSAPVTMTPYAIPVCTGPHHIPVCSAAHMQMCNTQPTWSIPACTVQLPSCSMQHIPACSLQQMPVPHSIPPILHHSHHPPPHHPLPHHPNLNPTGAHHPQFSHLTQPHIREDEVPILGDHRPHYPLPPSIHPGATLNPSPPVILQEPTVHPTPHDIYMGPYHRYYARRATGRSRLRGSLPPPPPPYPGFLLHFLAMLGNPTMPPYGRDPPDEATEENYEALLSLAERLGEAKPRGLSKADIKQLPAYSFNSETPRSEMDQTSCVVCMCDFESRQLLRVLPCSHEFHSKCVDKWLKTNRTCPICRADATDLSGSPSD